MARNKKLQSAPGSYFAIDREWRDGDTVKIQLPMRLHTENLPDTTNQVALLYGPIVLAGELGTNGMPNLFVGNQTEYSYSPDPPAPVFVCDADQLLKHVKPVAGKPLTFRTHGIGRPQDVTLKPFYQVHRQRYSVYWNLLSETAWKAHAAELAAVEARRIGRGGAHRGCGAARRTAVGN